MAGKADGGLQILNDCASGRAPGGTCYMANYMDVLGVITGGLSSVALVVLEVAALGIVLILSSVAIKFIRRTARTA